jgi:hypothetical protein
MESKLISNGQSLENSATGGEFQQRFERKFFVFPQNVGFAYQLLRQASRPDKEYPYGRVNSLYFDTPGLEQYERSASGEFRKDKVRIRWYGERDSLPEKVNVFLELKTRLGFASCKHRERFLVPREVLNLDQLGEGIIDRKALTDTVLKFGYFPKEPLRPIVTISYLRYRFTEMFTGIRVSLDYEICSTMVARELGHGERHLPLRGGVIEVKGPDLELPQTLRRIRLLDTEWSRFSKYSHSIDMHLERPVTRGRLWPVGRMGDS